jgi:hypothetical protein
MIIMISKIRLRDVFVGRRGAAEVEIGTRQWCAFDGLVRGGLDRLDAGDGFGRCGVAFVSDDHPGSFAVG